MDLRWRIELLGGLRARQGDRVISRFRTHKTGALLAYLAYHRQRAHRREELVELLWPECDPEAGRHSLRTELSWLRHQLELPPVERSEPAVGEPADAGRSKASALNAQVSTLIVADRTSVRLNPAAFST